MPPSSGHLPRGAPHEEGRRRLRQRLRPRREGLLQGGLRGPAVGLAQGVQDCPSDTHPGGAGIARRRLRKVLLAGGLHEADKGRGVDSEQRVGWKVCEINIIAT